MKHLLALSVVFLVLGCVNNMPVDSIAAGDHVYVDYTGRLENGTVFDSSEGRQPLEFDAGAGQMIKGFDAAVIGMKEGEEKTVVIQPEDAYGVPDPSLVFEVPLANVPNGTKAGDTLYSGASTVRVLEVNSETATIDANHFLAGKALVFDIKVVKIEKK